MIINSQFNDDQDYMFKNIPSMAEAAVEMDQEGSDSPFQGEEEYLIGHNHSALDT